MSAVKVYPAAKRRVWDTQIEFLDGTTIDATSDEDAVDRWRRMAAWTDESAITNPADWMERVLARARSFYQAGLIGLDGQSEATDILDALHAEQCLIIRRKG